MTLTPEPGTIHEYEETISTLKSLQEKWELAVSSGNSEGFDGYFEEIYGFLSNFGVIKDENFKRARIVIEKRLFPISQKVYNQNGRLGEADFNNYKLTPSDIRELFGDTDIDGVIESHRSKILELIGRSPTVRLSWEEIVATADGRMMPGTGTLQ